MRKADMELFSNEGLIQAKKNYEELLQSFDPAEYNNRITERILKQEYCLVLLEMRKRKLLDNNKVYIVMIDNSRQLITA
jgi:hypothetical protein